MFKKSGDRAICSICKKDFDAKQGSTSAITRHAIRKHKSAYDKLIEDQKKPKDNKKQLTIEEIGKRNEKYPRNSERKKKIDEKFLQFIIKGEKPFNISDDRTFCELLQTLDKKYQIPHRNTISNVMVPEAYEKDQEDLKNECKNLKYASLTTDLWSSASFDSYNGVTLHYWDNKSKSLKTKILDCSKVCTNTVTILY